MFFAISHCIRLYYKQNDYERFMKKAQYTPGPWIAEQEGTSENWCVRAPITINGINGTMVIIHGLMEADARRIAAAPQMLAALNVCMEELQLWANGINRHKVSKAMVGAKYTASTHAFAAIAKATGAA